MRWITRGLALMALLAAGCDGGSSGPGGLGEGEWGGEHVAMTVVADSARVEFDCAHGSLRLNDLSPGADQFSVDGTYTRETGVVHQDWSPPAEPARYTGILDGDRLTLQLILTDSGEELGPFQLARGQQGRVFKCL